MRRGGGGCLGKDGAYFKDEFKEKLSGVLEVDLSREGWNLKRTLGGTYRTVVIKSLSAESLLCSDLSKQATRMATILLSPHHHSTR